MTFYVACFEARDVTAADLDYVRFELRVVEAGCLK